MVCQINTDTTTQNVVGGKVGLMTCEFTIMLLALGVGGDSPGNLTLRIDTTPPAAKIGGCKDQSTFKRPAQGLEGFELGRAPNR